MKCAPKYHAGLLFILSIWIFTSRPAEANLFEISSYEAIFGLRVKINHSEKGVAAVVPEALSNRERDCLLRVGGNLDGFDGKLNLVGVLVGLNAQMLDQRDERLVILMLSTEVPNFLQSVEFSRSSMNVILAACPLSDSVANKAKEALGLYDEAVSIIGPMAKKISIAAPQ